MHFIEEFTNMIFLEDQPEKSDIIFIPGSGHAALAHTAARLYHSGLAPLILPSGKYSKLTGYFPGPSDQDEEITPPKSSGVWESEWDFLHDVLTLDHVPESAILKENKATFTYENAVYSRKLTDHLGLKIHKAIICCQAFHARRAKMYYEILYPNTQFFICPSVTQNISRENWYLDPEKIQTVLGELSRMGSQFNDLIVRYGTQYVPQKTDGSQQMTIK